jgi:hypothetical protein
MVGRAKTFPTLNFKIMDKFKLGDIVIAKKNDTYIVTTDGWEGEIISIDYKNKTFTAVSPINGMFSCLEFKYFYLKYSENKIYELWI